MTYTPETTDLLVVVDVQTDFLEGGALAVPDGSAVIPEITRLAKVFDNIAITQDWHPAGHASFASSHDGKTPFDAVEMPYGTQILWPDHCVIGSTGAELRADAEVLDAAQIIVRKGFRPGIDSYSAFLENDGVTPTGLAGAMRERGLTRAVFTGLALDFCVGFSALDARKLGFEAIVELSACRGIADESIEDMMGRMREAGVEII